ncbi:unnamed protein product, partial [Ectocarpus fasciculatus]
QADLLYLPTTDEDYKYLLTVTDLWSQEIDARPLKSRTAKVVLDAMQDILDNGKHINDVVKLRTDNGSEFKGAFHKYFYDNGILHTYSLAYRHKQTGSIESVNKLLGRFLNTYMSTNKTSNWTDIDLPKLITKINKIRKIEDEDPFTYIHKPPKTINSKYDIGDIVIRKLDRPIDENNMPIAEHGFRMGDLRYDRFQPRKIVNVLYYPQNVRYILEGFDNVSYTEDELLPAPESESKYNVHKIWNKTRIKNKTHYRVWFKGEKKKQSQWIDKKSLIEDGLQEEIDEYENS